MKQIWSLILCLFLLLSCLAGCKHDASAYVPTGDALDSDKEDSAPIQKPDATQNLSMAYYPQRSMNPYQCVDFTNRALFPLMYQGLFAVDRKYNVVPILCREFQYSQDMKTYSFTLNAARFSDGTALTVEDVVSSLNAARENTYYAGRFLHITSVSAAGDSVVIQLDTPFENLPILLDIPIVKASQVDSDAPLGTGAYLLEDALGGKRLRRQAAWWCNGVANLVVTAPYIPLVEAQSSSHIRDQFEFADVGLVCADPGSDTYADYRCDYEIWDCENGLFLYLVTNAKSAFFSNDAVRQALTHAIDRDALVKTYYRGFARSATLPASPLSPYYDAKLAERYGYAPEKFKAAIEDAGLTGTTLTMIVNPDDSLRLRVAKRVAQMLTDCGVTVEIKEISSNKLAEHLLYSQYDLYLAQTKLSPNMDLSAFFKPYGSLNYGGLYDSAIYTMALEALANKGNYYNLHEMVMEDAQLCPILVRSYCVYATRGLVTTLQPSRDNLFFHNVGRSLESALVQQQKA